MFWVYAIQFTVMSGFGLWMCWKNQQRGNFQGILVLTTIVAMLLSISLWTLIFKGV